MEVFQESYQPEVVKEKEQALKLIQENVTQKHAHQVRMFKKLHTLTASDDDLRIATPAELEEFRRKMRRSHLRTPHD
jgi:polyphosphate kinase